MPKCMNYHKAILVITRSPYHFNDFIWILRSNCSSAVSSAAVFRHLSFSLSLSLSLSLSNQRWAYLLCRFSLTIDNELHAEFKWTKLFTPNGQTMYTDSAVHIIRSHLVKNFYVKLCVNRCITLLVIYLFIVSLTV